MADTISVSGRPVTGERECVFAGELCLCVWMNQANRLQWWSMCLSLLNKLDVSLLMVRKAFCFYLFSSVRECHFIYGKVLPRQQITRCIFSYIKKFVEVVLRRQPIYLPFLLQTVGELYSRSRKYEHNQNNAHTSSIMRNDAYLNRQMELTETN